VDQVVVSSGFLRFELLQLSLKLVQFLNFQVSDFFTFIHSQLSFFASLESAGDFVPPSFIPGPTIVISFLSSLNSHSGIYSMDFTTGIHGTL